MKARRWLAPRCYIFDGRAESVQMKPSQLTLAVKPSDDSCFENYFVSDANQQVVASLRNIPLHRDLFYLWGAPQTGKTHLLLSVAAQSENSFYLSFKEKSQMHPDLCDGLHELKVVCLDDIHCVVGDLKWEEALFNLFNRIKESDCSLLISANAAPISLANKLPDLHSRLQSLLIYQLANLDDDEKKRALQLRAGYRGFTLNDAVADYIMLRAGRSFLELVSVLNILDDRTLADQRRLSIPLVRETLGW